MRWLDYGYNDDAVYEIGLGIKGVHWTDADPGSTGPSGYPAAIKRIPIKEGERYYNNLAGIGTPPVGVNTERKFNLEAVPDDMYAPDGSGTERMLQYVTDTNYKPYSQPISSILPPLWYSADQASRIAMLTTNINTYVEESSARFITGQMNIETQWDSFQAQLKSLGIDEYLKIIQDTYDKSSFAKK
jgi:putative aldouronate transport system substrate-binding protein